MRKPRIAVIGTGIAGLASAWLLSRAAEVTVYEADARVGGHSNTVTVDDPLGPVAVDTGFIVHNRGNYPQLCALFDALGVLTQPGEMSFAVSVDHGRLEYSGSSLNGLFGQRRNLLRPGFHRMLLDIARFNRAGKRLAREGGDERESLGAFLDRHRLGGAVREHYLLPMAAAIWSCPPATMLDFPALSLVRFYDNHGLLNINERPQWLTVTGGSARYVRAIMAPWAPRLRLATPVTRVLSHHPAGVHPHSPVGVLPHSPMGVLPHSPMGVLPHDAGVRVFDAHGGEQRFEQVVVATHADQARRILGDDDVRARLLDAFRYQRNRAVLHRDHALMPRRRRVWSAWNYLAHARQAPAQVSVTYWMNRLQRLHAARDYFVSLNPLREPDASQVIAQFDYSHPVFDAGAMEAQRRLPQFNGIGGVWLAGSYFGHGFHEDALRSALDVAARLGQPAPWIAPDAPRAVHLPQRGAPARVIAPERVA